MELTRQPFFVSTIMQAILYTLYLTSLGFALRWLLYKEERWIRRSRKEINWFLLTIAVVLFAFSTGDIVISVLLQLAFNGFKSKIEAVGKPLLIAGTMLEVWTFLITDAVLIFRCWIVYRRSWCAICIPLLLWVSNILLTAFFALYSATAFKQDVPFRFLRAAVPFYGCNFATNLYTTCAIVYRVRRVVNANNSGPSVLLRVSRIVVEAGMLYATTSLAIFVAAFLMPNDLVAYFVCNAINFSMAGIAFNLLVIRVGQLRANIEMDDCPTTPGVVNESVVLSTVQFGVPSNSFGSESGYRGESAETSMQEKRLGFDSNAKQVSAALASRNTLMREAVDC